MRAGEQKFRIIGTDFTFMGYTDVINVYSNEESVQGMSTIRLAKSLVEEVETMPADAIAVMFTSSRNIDDKPIIWRRVSPTSDKFLTRYNVEVDMGYIREIADTLPKFLKEID